jgi:hypothetical protein
MAVGQCDVVYRAQLTDLGQEWKGVVLAGRAPSPERRFDRGAWTIGGEARARLAGDPWRHCTNPEHSMCNHEILPFSVLKYPCCSIV